MRPRPRDFRLPRAVTSGAWRKWLSGWIGAVGAVALRREGPRSEVWEWLPCYMWEEEPRSTSPMVVGPCSRWMIRVGWTSTVAPWRLLRAWRPYLSRLLPRLSAVEWRR